MLQELISVFAFFCISCVVSVSVQLFVIVVVACVRLQFVTVGKFVEAYAKGASAGAISALLKLQPQEAALVVREAVMLSASLGSAGVAGGSATEELRVITLDLLQRGDLVKVRGGSGLRRCMMLRSFQRLRSIISTAVSFSSEYPPGLAGATGGAAAGRWLGALRHELR